MSHFLFTILLYACSTDDISNSSKELNTDAESEAAAEVKDSPSYQIMADGRYSDSDERIVIVSNDSLFSEDNFESAIQLNAMPSLEGNLERLSDTRLAYYPTNLKANTTYKIKAKIDSTEYETDLTTGEFAILSSSVFRTGMGVKVNITTSAAVGCAEAESALKLKSGSTQIAPSQCDEAQYPNTLDLIFPVANAIKKVRLTGRLNALESSDFVLLSQEQELKDSKPMTIAFAAVQEAGEAQHSHSLQR